MTIWRSEVSRAIASLIAPKKILRKGRCLGLPYRFLAAVTALVMVGSARGQGVPQDQAGSRIASVIGGRLMSQGTTIDWATYADATLGLVGYLGNNSAATVVVLPLQPAALSVNDWLALGIDPVDAAVMIGQLLPGQNLYAVLDLEEQLQSVVLTSCGAGPPASNTVVVTAPPNSPPMTIEEWVELLIRLLEEYKRQLHPENDPNGAW